MQYIPSNLLFDVGRFTNVLLRANHNISASKATLKNIKQNNQSYKSLAAHTIATELIIMITSILMIIMIIIIMKIMISLI